MNEAASVRQPAGSPVRLGLKDNWRQFSLLVLINAFVGGMVGIERTVVPLIGAEEFGIASTTLVVSFIISFGVVKAFANLVSGQLADLWGRKRVLVLGWLVGLPVPFMIIWAPNWQWVIAANALLGVNQGLAWSMTVIMKVDLVGPQSRGISPRNTGCDRYRSISVSATRCWGPRCRSSSSATRATTFGWRPRLTQSRQLRSASGKSLRSPRSRTATCSPPRRPGS